MQRVVSRRTDTKSAFRPHHAWGTADREGLGQLDRLFGEVLLQSGQILYKWQFLTKIDGVEWRGAVWLDFAENALQVICLNVE